MFPLTSNMYLIIDFIVYGFFPSNSEYSNLDFLFFRNPKRLEPNGNHEVFLWIIWFIWKAKNEKSLWKGLTRSIWHYKSHLKWVLDLEGSSNYTPWDKWTNKKIFKDIIFKMPSWRILKNIDLTLVYGWIYPQKNEFRGE